MLDPAAEKLVSLVVSKAISNRYLWNNFDFNQVKRTWTDWNGPIAVKTDPDFSPFWCLTEENGLELIFNK